MREKLKFFVLGALLGVLSTGFIASVILNPLSNQLVISTFWYQRANEKKALYYQGFNLAKNMIDRAVANYTGTKPLAVIVDIDETMLDNSPYQARIIKAGKNFEYKTWNQWVSEAKAKALPGAVEFTKYAKSKGVEVFYITNRHESTRAATLRNLKNDGFEYVDNEHLLLKTTTSDKTARRQKVLAKYNVICYLGDNMGDFDESMVDFKPQSSVKVDKNAALFGSKYIVMPNPMYGSWSRIKYPDDVKSDKQKAEYRIKLLNEK